MSLWIPAYWSVSPSECSSCVLDVLRLVTALLWEALTYHMIMPKCLSHWWLESMPNEHLPFCGVDQMERARVQVPFSPLLASISCSLDNSEYSRNGDYYPSRLESQQMGLDTILTFRLQSPDQRVGLATSAGAGVEILHTGSALDTEVKDAMDAAHLKPAGTARPLQAVRIAAVRRASHCTSFRALCMAHSPPSYHTITSLSHLAAIAQGPPSARLLG